MTKATGKIVVVMTPDERKLWRRMRDAGGGQRERMPAEARGEFLKQELASGRIKISAKLGRTSVFAIGL